LAPYRIGQGWYAWRFIEIGDPYVTEEAEYDLELHTPESIVIAASGEPSRQAGTWQFHLDRARAIGFSASPDYRQLRGDVNGIPVYSYYLTGHERAGHDVLTATVQSLELFGNLYGAYPYTSLTIAEDAFFGSMEYTAFVLHFGAGYAEYNGRPDSMLIALTAHEIAHQWWYSLVGTDQVEEPWLDEGLAMYSELAFYRAYYPELEKWFWASRVNVYHPAGALSRSIYDFPDSQTYVHQLYRRGVLFFDELQSAMGRDAFYRFLQALRHQAEHEFLTTEQFFETLGRHVTSKIDAILVEYFPDRPRLAAMATPPPGIATRSAFTPVLTYTVQVGDTLWGIAMKFNTTIELIKRANHLTDEGIRPGQTLIIPVP
jgi:aminopeptidase N